MSRRPQLAVQIDEYARLSNRARFLEESSHGIFLLLEKAGKNRAWLARRLGCSPPMVSKVMEGSHNFTLETLADIGLAFGRGAHLVWGADPHEMRFPVDEADLAQSMTAISIADHFASAGAMPRVDFDWPTATNPVLAKVA